MKFLTQDKNKLYSEKKLYLIHMIFKNKLGQMEETTNGKDSIEYEGILPRNH